VIESWHPPWSQGGVPGDFATKAAGGQDAAWIADSTHDAGHSSWVMRSPADKRGEAGKGRSVSAAGPTGGVDNGGGCAAASLECPLEGTGPPLRPQGAASSRCARRLRPPWPPGDPCGPEEVKRPCQHAPARPGTRRRATP